MSSTSQTDFDKKYISSREILERLDITRPTLSQAHRGPRKLLPEPIVVSGYMLHLWEREVVEPILSGWKLLLDARKRRNP